MCYCKGNYPITTDLYQSNWIHNFIIKVAKSFSKYISKLTLFKKGQNYFVCSIQKDLVSTYLQPVTEINQKLRLFEFLPATVFHFLVSASIFIFWMWMNVPPTDTSRPGLGRSGILFLEQKRILGKKSEKRFRQRDPILLNFALKMVMQLSAQFWC